MHGLHPIIPITESTLTLASGSPVLLDIEGRIARVTLNRPDQGNALDISTAEAFKLAIGRIAADPGVRVVFITGAGKRFCVGGDIQSFAARPDQLAENIGHILGPINAALEQLASLPVIVVTGLNGAVGGGGVGLALCADLVVAAESVKLGAGYSAIGLSPDAGASWQLTRRIGVMRAKELFLTNRPLTAAECLAWGIVNTVVPDAEFAAACEQLTTRLAHAAHGSSLAIKHLVDHAASNSLEAHLALEGKNMLVSAASDDAREGVRAFMEKRRPKFD